MKILKLSNKLKLKNWKLNKALDEAAGDYKTYSYPTATELHSNARYARWVPKKWKINQMNNLYERLN